MSDMPVPDEAVEAACVAAWNSDAFNLSESWEGLTSGQQAEERQRMRAALAAAAPFIRAQGECECRASALEDYARSLSKYDTQGRDRAFNRAAAEREGGTR